MPDMISHVLTCHVCVCTEQWKPGAEQQRAGPAAVWRWWGLADQDSGRTAAPDGHHYTALTGTWWLGTAVHCYKSVCHDHI